MKSFVYAMVAVSALSSPLASYAQSSDNGPMTRAQVRQELIDLEQAGYSPTAEDPYYPNDIQAAERRVHAQMGYGGSPAGTSQSSAPVAVEPAHPISPFTRQSLFFGQ